ncbi:hypothetical protein RUND412_009870 [Rhizina undulata]
MASQRIFMTITRTAAGNSAPWSAVRCRGSSFSILRPIICPSYPASPSPSLLPRIRYHSEASSQSKVYDFEEIGALAASRSPDHILIDVREPGEYQAGFIPTAINIPIGSAPDALSLSADEFEDRFGFAKPPADKELVFYCKAGVRSSAAAQLALQNGYEKVGEYRGSWLDWEKKKKQ